jgi:hypothetical protein
MNNLKNFEVDCCSFSHFSKLQASFVNSFKSGENGRSGNSQRNDGHFTFSVH